MTDDSEKNKNTNNIVAFRRDDNAPRKVKREIKESPLFALLAEIDELEEALEVMDEHDLTTRDDLESLIGRLETQAAELEDASED